MTEKAEVGAKRTIVLVSCVKTKRSKPSRAEDLYTSALFKKASTYAKRVGDAWYILSAKYGLVTPEQVIAPYELTLNKMSVYDRQYWAKRVVAELKLVLEPGDRVVFLAGVRYRENLLRPIRRLGCTIEIPMEGLAFGQQLQWLGDV